MKIYQVEYYPPHGYEQVQILGTYTNKLAAQQCLNYYKMTNCYYSLFIEQYEVEDEFTGIQDV